MLGGLSTPTRPYGPFRRTLAEMLDTKNSARHSDRVTTSPRSLIDRIHDGRFDARLAKMRAAGQSYRQMSSILRAEGFDVSHETLRQWCRDLEKAS